MLLVPASTQTLHCVANVNDYEMSMLHTPDEGWNNKP
jgi:hypothetical protein